jgi:hypothetical protein
MFEALGYSKNKDIMLKLAKAVNVKFLQQYKDDSAFSQIIESALFNVSGLIPEKTKFNQDETTGYVRKLIEDWNKIRNNYDGQIFKLESWHFFKLRPANFPTIRIAGGSRLIFKIVKEDLMANLISLFEKDEDLKSISFKIREMIITKADGYWHNHFTFDKYSKEDIKYYVGISRADEMIVNVILPILLLYFEIFSKAEPAKRVKNLYVNYFQQGSNKLVSQVAEELDLKKASKKSVNYQGIIDLFRNYCIKERCLECKIGERIFN